MFCSKNKLRETAPPNGKQYELFDTAVGMFSIFFVGYVLIQPPGSVLDALRAPLYVFDERFLGVMVSGAALFGAVLAYKQRHLNAAYMVPKIAFAFMTLNFFVSCLVLTINWALMWPGWDFLSRGDLLQAFRAAWIYMFFCGMATRRLSRDEKL